MLSAKPHKFEKSILYLKHNPQSIVEKNDGEDDVEQVVWSVQWLILESVREKTQVRGQLRRLPTPQRMPFIWTLWCWLPNV